MITGLARCPKKEAPSGYKPWDVDIGKHIPKYLNQDMAPENNNQINVSVVILRGSEVLFHALRSSVTSAIQQPHK